MGNLDTGQGPRRPSPRGPRGPRGGRGGLIALAILLTGLLTLAAASAPLWAVGTGPLDLNQRFIERAWTKSGAFLNSERLLALRSRYAAGLDRLLDAKPDIESVDLEDPDAVLGLLFEQIPPLAIVYPTETYYYYRFRHGHRRIAGNIRLLDAADGVIHIGYFDRDDRGFVRSKTFTAEDGLEIETLAENIFRVTYRDRNIRFVLPVRALAQPSTLEVLEHEEFVTGVLDESGVPLSLLFNDLTGGFYYILNEEIGATERLIPVEGDENCLIGERTRFVYLREPEFGRTLLVGVDAANIQANNYFDGPFDQVPPRLQIKEKLERAYPYTLLRGGIDDHGNFRELEHQRVAISPYQTYQSVAAAAESIREHIAEALLPSERWDRLTYESKRRSPTTQAAMNEGIDVPQYVAQGWPANHWGYTSALWPATHQAAHSGLWPANHTAQTSAR